MMFALIFYVPFHCQPNKSSKIFDIPTNKALTNGVASFSSKSAACMMIICDYLKDAQLIICSFVWQTSFKTP